MEDQIIAHRSFSYTWNFHVLHVYMERSSQMSVKRWSFLNICINITSNFLLQKWHIIAFQLFLIVWFCSVVRFGSYTLQRMIHIVRCVDTIARPCILSFKKVSFNSAWSLSLTASAWKSKNMLRQCDINRSKKKQLCSNFISRSRSKVVSDN